MFAGGQPAKNRNLLGYMGYWLRFYGQLSKQFLSSGGLMPGVPALQ